MSQIEAQKLVQEERFEFSLFVNDNIICQRFFKIRDFDESLTPMDENAARNYKRNPKKEAQKIEKLRQLGEALIFDEYTYHEGIIPTFLKKKSMDYLWENYKPYFNQSEDSYKTPPKKGDNFRFEFKVDKMPVLTVGFPNEYFTLNPKVNVDIREIIQDIITEIRHITSVKK